MIKRKTTLHLFDEVNVAFEGLEKHHINKIIKATKLMIKGAFHTAEYKMKITDGMESQFFSSGRTYFYMLDKVLPMVESFGYDIAIEDYRESITTPKHIDKDFIAYTGLELYWYQVESINKLIDTERGVFELPTSAGKGLLSAIVTKVYEDQLEFITIVPTEKLVKQVYADCDMVGLDIGHITKKMSKKQREVEWSKKHVVCTWQLLKNNKHRLERFGGLIYDEMHVMGDVMFNILETELCHAVVRLGMTGTVPKDKHKREKILCHIGGDVLIKIAPKQLQDEGYISTCDIEMYSIEHRLEIFDISEWEWSDEDRYLLSNNQRASEIADFVLNLKKETTLILCFKEFANKLKSLTGYDVITGDTPEKEREEYYYKLEHEKDYQLIATYDTVGTGTSIDPITCVVTVDIGKNETRIVQSIGRGLRKDGNQNHLKVIDIYTKMCIYNSTSGKWVDFSFSGTKHVKERIRQYKKLHYPYKEVSNTIIS